jgi:hypothetical protein
MIQVKSAMCDSSAFKLPSDAMPALFALSLRRKLRYLYQGQYFRFRVGDEEFDYPENEVPSNAYLVRIYDQKARVGIPRFDAVQLDQSKQPVITDNLEAQFEFGVYMDLENNPTQHIGKDFTITCIGSGDHPRPMIGVFGESDQITIEPGEFTTRFTFNQNMGSIGNDSNSRINQMFSGYDPAQNGNRVVSMQSDGPGQGHNLSENVSTEFDTISIGRSQERGFLGTFIEATMHLGNLTKVASNKLWEEAKLVY